MPKQNEPQRDIGEQVFVSAFLANHVIPEVSEDVYQFTLEGVGWGWWTTERGFVEVDAADLFVMVHWVNARRGAYEVQIDVRDIDGEPIASPFYRELKEIPSQHYVSSWNVPLTGLVIPRGTYYLWVSVEDVPKTAVMLQVYGPDGP